MEDISCNIEDIVKALFQFKVDHQDISWQHFIDVYKWDLGQENDAFGLRKLSKLRDEHVRLTPQHRMKVKYAAQVIYILTLEINL